MSMTITIPDEIADRATEIAERTGITPEQLLLDTLRRQQLLSVPPELREEFEMWELASEEDIAAFDRREGIT